MLVPVVIAPPKLYMFVTVEPEPISTDHPVTLNVVTVAAVP